MLPPSSGSKNKQARNQHEALLTFDMLDLFFDLENGGDIRPKRRFTLTDYMDLIPEHRAFKCYSKFQKMG
jgi:hypothetical protein